MELIKDLPEVFEEFAEQRQKSFLAVKELKEKGVPLSDGILTIDELVDELCRLKSKM